MAGIPGRRCDESDRANPLKRLAEGWPVGKGTGTTSHTAVTLSGPKIPGLADRPRAATIYRSALADVDQSPHRPEA